MPFINAYNEETKVKDFSGKLKKMLEVVLRIVNAGRH